MPERDSQRLLASGKLISIAQAARQTPYSPEYLGLLARKGRIEAIKIARDWLTTRQAVLSYIKQQEQKHKRILRAFAKA